MRNLMSLAPWSRLYWRSRMMILTSELGITIINGSTSNRIHWFINTKYNRSGAQTYLFFKRGVWKKNTHTLANIYRRGKGLQVTFPLVSHYHRCQIQIQTLQVRIRGARSRIRYTFPSDTQMNYRSLFYKIEPQQFPLIQNLTMQEYFKIRNFAEVPIQAHERRRTDICCTIVSSLFVIFIFIIAVAYFNSVIIARWAYPTNSAGRTCGQDLPYQPYLYFASVTDTSKRLCLSQCPQIRQKRVLSYPLNCYPNILQDTNAEIYDTYPEQTYMGNFCFPTDPIVKDALILKSGIQDRYRVLQAFKTVGYSLMVALLAGIIYMVLVQSMPQVMVFVSVVVGGLAMIAFGVLLLSFYPEAYPNMVLFRYLISAGSIIFGIILIGMLFYCTKQLKLTGVFLRYAGKFLRNRPVAYLVIAVFLILVAALIGLFIFQYLAFFSFGDMGYSVFSPYYQLRSTWRSGVLHFLNVIVLFWGLNFLRQASVFVISGLAAEWYTHRAVNPVKNLICYHWGSVVACSFMVGFFGILDMLYLLLTPQPAKMRLNACGRLCSYVTSPLESISTYIRQEAMTYINLTGLPYCNASVYCQFLNWESYITHDRGSRPIMRYYRYAAYAFLISFALIFGVMHENATIRVVPFLSILSIWVLSLYVVSGFVDIHADAASALMVTLMLEQQLEGSIDQVRQAPEGLVPILKSPKLQ